MSQPLWRVMEAAFLDGRSPGFNDCHGYAAELRAIAIQIAKQDPDNAMSALAVEEWLRAEAARAEAGE